MRFDKFVVAAAVAASGVSALPTANPVADTDAISAPVGALTARNLALHSRSPVAGGKSSKSSKKSKSTKSSKSGSYDHGYYKRIRSASPASKAMKRSVWKYFKVRSAVAEPTGYDSGSKKSGKSGKSKKSGKSGKSNKSGSGKSGYGGHYTRRHIVVHEPEPNANEAVRRWLGLTPRDAEATDYGYPYPKSSSCRSSKSGKSKKSKKSKKSGKSKKSKKSHKSGKSSGGHYYVRRDLAVRDAAVVATDYGYPYPTSHKSGKSGKSSKSKKSGKSRKSGKSSKSSNGGHYVLRRLA